MKIIYVSSSGRTLASRSTRITDHKGMSVGTIVRSIWESTQALVPATTDKVIKNKSSWDIVIRPNNATTKFWASSVPTDSDLEDRNLVMTVEVVDRETKTAVEADSKLGANKFDNNGNIIKADALTLDEEGKKTLVETMRCALYSMFNPDTVQTSTSDNDSKETTMSNNSLTALASQVLPGSLLANAADGFDQAASKKAAEALILALKSALGDKYPDFLASDDNVGVIVWTSVIRQLLSSNVLPLDDAKVSLLQNRIDAAQKYAFAQLTDGLIGPLFAALGAFGGFDTSSML